MIDPYLRPLDIILEKFWFLFEPGPYYFFIIIMWLLCVFSLYKLKLKFSLQKKDMILITAFVLPFSILALRFYDFTRIVDAPPNLLMASCMTDLSNIYSSNLICHLQNFGITFEIGWPSLISFVYRLIGINVMIPSILSTMFYVLCMILVYMLLQKVEKDRLLRLIMLGFVFSLPINFLQISSPSKDALYLFFVFLLYYIYVTLEPKTINYFWIGILISFMTEIRLQSFIFLVIFFVQIVYRKKHFIQGSVYLFLPMFLTIPYKMRNLAWRSVAPALKDMSFFDFISENIFFDSKILIVITILVSLYLAYRCLKQDTQAKRVMFFLSMYNLLTYWIFYWSSDADKLYHQLLHLSFTSWLLLLLVSKDKLKKAHKWMPHVLMAILLILSVSTIKSSNIYSKGPNLLEQWERLSDFNDLMQEKSNESVIMLDNRGYYEVHDYMSTRDIRDFNILTLFHDFSEEQPSIQLTEQNTSIIVVSRKKIAKSIEKNGFKETFDMFGMPEVDYPDIAQANIRFLDENYEIVDVKYSDYYGILMLEIR